MREGKMFLDNCEQLLGALGRISPPFFLILVFKPCPNPRSDDFMIGKASGNVKSLKGVRGGRIDT
jgi:hypothetical protein